MPFINQEFVLFIPTNMKIREFWKHKIHPITGYENDRVLDRQMLIKKQRPNTRYYEPKSAIK